MSETGLPVLDHTVQLTNTWLKRLVDEHHFADRRHAYSALRATLHALRDRLTAQQATHLGAQLPLLVRGIYYEGWHLTDKPVLDRHLNEFLSRVADNLPPSFPQDPRTVSQAVFDLLWKELDFGESSKVVGELPGELRFMARGGARLVTCQRSASVHRRVAPPATGRAHRPYVRRHRQQGAGGPDLPWAESD